MNGDMRQSLGLALVGAVLLALGYQIFMWWVAANPDIVPVERETPVAP